MSERVRALRLEKSEMPGRRAGTRRRGWFWLAAAVLLAGGIFLGVREGFDRDGHGVFASGNEVDAITVTVEPPAGIVLDTSGYIIAHSKVKAGPSIPGTVVEVNFDEGQKVKKGDVLARLDDTQYRADSDQAQASLALAQAHLKELRAGSRQEDLRQAKAQLEQAKTRRDLSEKDFRRAEQLKDTISPSEHDRAKAAYLEAEARVDQLTTALELLELGPREEQIAAAEAEVESAKALATKARYFLARTEITAPIAGTLIERTVEVGETILPDSIVTGAFLLADLDRLEAEIDIQEQDLAEIRIGQHCLITAEADAGRKYRGRLDWLSPVMNRQRGIRPARIKILDAGEKLLPDMNCRVQILERAPPANSAGTMRIPRRAVVRESGQAVVYVLEDGRVARRRVVELGQPRDDLVQVRRGLHSGEVLLVPREKPLQDGQAVQPVM